MGWLTRIFAKSPESKAVATPPASVHLARLAMDENIEEMAGKKVYTDSEALFAAGKAWEDLDVAARDPQWQSALAQRVGKSAKAKVEIDADEEQQESAALLRDVFGNLPVRRLVRRALSAGIGQGFGVAEILWEVVDGRWIPVDLIDKPPRWFKFGEEGDLLFLPDGQTPVELPEKKFLVYQHEARSDNPYGTKLLAVLFWAIYIKKHAKKFRSIYLEKFSIPPIIATYKGELSKAEEAALNNLLRAWSTDMGIKVPDSIELEIKDAVRQGEDPFDRVLRHCDSEINKRVLGGSLTLESSSEAGRGTHAMGEVHLESLNDIVDADAADMADLLGSLGRWIIDLNLGTQETYPTVRLVTRKKAVDKDRNEQTRAWWQAGLPVPLKHAYEISLIPQPEDDEPLLPPPPKPHAEAPPMKEEPEGDAPEAETPGEVDKPKRPESATKTAEEKAFARTDGIDAVATAAENRSERDMDEFLSMVSLSAPDRFDNFKARIWTILSEAQMSGGTDAVNMKAAADAMAEMAERLRAAEKGEPGLVPESVIQPIYEHRLFARLLGREHLMNEARAQVPGMQFSRNEFADGMTFAEPFDTWKTDPAAAIRALKARQSVDPEVWRKMTIWERNKAFTYAYAPSLTMVESVRQALLDAVSEGKSFREFRDEVDRVYADEGLDRLSSFYAETIFRNNVMSAYAHGRWEQYTQPHMMKAFPWRELHTAGDAAVRPEHQALAGVYRADDPFLQLHTPPIEHNCRCGIRIVSEARLLEKGLEVRTGAEVLDEMDPGMLRKINKGLAKGFGNTKGW